MKFYCGISDAVSVLLKVWPSFHFSIKYLKSPFSVEAKRLFYYFSCIKLNMICSYCFVFVFFCFGRSELVLSGLKDDVYKALESLAELLQDYKAALTCAEYVIWQYRDPKSAEMTDFLLRESSKIESNYKVKE